MLKVVNDSGKLLYLNLSSVESWDPDLNQLVLLDGRIMTIDPLKSDVSLLESRYGHHDADLYYMRQFIVNISALLRGKCPAILIQEGVSEDVLSLSDDAWNRLSSAVDLGVLKKLESDTE